MWTALTEAAAIVLKTEPEKLRSVEVVARALLRENSMDIIRTVRKMAENGLKEAKRSFLIQMEERIAKKHVNMTNGEFQTFLNEISYDPMGKFSVSGFVTAILTTTSIIIVKMCQKITTYKNELTHEKELKRGNRKDIRGMEKEKKALEAEGYEIAPLHDQTKDNRYEEVGPAGSTRSKGGFLMRQDGRKFIVEPWS